jgi:hypothetical protein
MSEILSIYERVSGILSMSEILSMVEANSMESYTIEQIKDSPFLLCKYSFQKSKGKLPKDLHDAMTLHGMINAKDWYVKFYFDVLIFGNVDEILP